MKGLRLGFSGFVSVVALLLMAALLQARSGASTTVLAAPAATTCTWNGSNGNWSDSSKWSCGLVPGAADTAIVNSGSVSVDVPSTIGTLLLGGTTTSLTGSQPITVSHAMTWTGLSQLLGIGLTTIDTNATLVISQTPTNMAFTRPMLNKGQIDLIASSLFFNTVPSSGVFTNTNTGQVNLGGTGVFRPFQISNYGVVRNSDNNLDPALLGGGLIDTFGFFDNYGTIIAQNGNLNLGTGIRNQAGGNITLANGNLVCYQELAGHAGGFLALNGGTLSGNGSADCNVTNAGGLVAPGVIAISGSYVQQAGGTLNIQIGGPTLKNYAALIVVGSATLNGALNISLINGYVPALFDGFSIVRYASHSGTFATVVNPIAATHPLSYTADQVVLGTPHHQFQTGNLFASVGHGLVKEFDPDGNVIAVLNTTTSSKFTAGMCFDASGNLFVTGFGNQTISKFNNSGKLISATFGTGYPAFPESCVFDAAGNIYVGEVGPGPGLGALEKRDPNGTLINNFVSSPPLFDQRGIDWIDLAADQRTLLYASEGTKILAYDVITPAQLPWFASGLPAPCYATRIRQNGEVMTACSSAVYRLSPTGTVIMSYTAASLNEHPINPDNGLFALNLDSDGTSFWTAGYESGVVHRVDIATGTVLKSFGAMPFTSVAGLIVYGEVQVGRPGLALIETVGTDPSACATTREITIPATTTVTYCYRAINTGSITLTTHSLTDTVSGNIFTNDAITLAPGASTFVTRSVTLHTTMINIATWSATNGTGKQATTSDFTRVDGPGTGVSPSNKKVYLPVVMK